jgi:hypothetical protein
MRLRSLAPLGSRTVMAKVWAVAELVAGDVLAMTGGCWFGVAMAGACQYPSGAGAGVVGGPDVEISGARGVGPLAAEVEIQCEVRAGGGDGGARAGDGALGVLMGACRTGE